MSDQHVVVDELLRAADNGESAVLVSVVRTAGSTYRGVGSRMIVRGDDTTCGLLSGGCLEADLVEHARNVRASGRPAMVAYDTSSGDDFVWGLGLGCDGVVEVLLESFTPERARELARLLGSALDSAKPAVLATIIRSPGTPRVGARMVLDSVDTTVRCDGDWGDASLLPAITVDAHNGGVSARRGLTREYQLGSSQVQVAFELVMPRVDVLLCGSGPDVAPVARLASGLGWAVAVIDRSVVTLKSAERFAGARVVQCGDAIRLGDVIELTPRTAVVLMSHSYERDLEYLNAIADTNVGYIGVLGPRTRTDRMLADLASRGRSDVATLRERIYGPIGLDIGGDGPEAIALAIVAEIAAVISGRSGSHLRDRRAPIHGEPASTPHA